MFTAEAKLKGMKNVILVKKSIKSCFHKLSMILLKTDSKDIGSLV